MTFIYNTPSFSQERLDFSYENYAFGLGDSLNAMAGETLMHNPTNALSRLLEDRFYDESEPKITAEEANEKYAIGNLRFEGPVTESRAKRLYERQKQSLERAEILEKGPSGAGPTLAKFGTALAASAVDPLNIASAFLPSTAVLIGARALKTTAPAWALGRGATVGSRALYGAVEGAVGAAIIEPLPYLAAQRDDLEYGMLDSFLNITIGGVFGGGLHGVAKALELRGEKNTVRKITETSERISALSEENRRLLLGDAVAYTINDTIPDVGPKISKMLRQSRAVDDMHSNLADSADAFDAANLSESAIDGASSGQVLGNARNTAVTAQELRDISPEASTIMDNIAQVDTKIAEAINNKNNLVTSTLETYDPDTAAILRAIDEKLSEPAITKKAAVALERQKQQIIESVDRPDFRQSMVETDAAFKREINTLRRERRGLTSKLKSVKKDALAAAQRNTVTPARQSQAPPKDMFVSPEEVQTEFLPQTVSTKDIEGQMLVSEMEMDELLAPLPEEVRSDYRALMEQANQEIAAAQEINDAVRQLGICVTRIG